MSSHIIFAAKFLRFAQFADFFYIPFANFDHILRKIKVKVKQVGIAISARCPQKATLKVMNSEIAYSYYF
ncbi:MAG: hypothetical protein IJV72_01120 [Clostridia bacterium]|nr:hypothetical protein [Clostridia bacterium]